MYINKAIAIRCINSVGATKTKTFGDVLREYLHLSGTSQTKFVAKVHAVTQEVGERFTIHDVNNYIYGIKGVKMNPKANKLAAVIKATGMPYEYWTGAISYNVACAIKRAGMTK